MLKAGLIKPVGLFVAMGELQSVVPFILYVTPDEFLDISIVTNAAVIAIPVSVLVSTPPCLDTQNQFVSASSFSKYIPEVGKRPDELSRRPILVVVFASTVLSRTTHTLAVGDVISIAVLLLYSRRAAVVPDTAEVSRRIMPNRLDSLTITEMVPFDVIHPRFPIAPDVVKPPRKSSCSSMVDLYG